MKKSLSIIGIAILLYFSTAAQVGIGTSSPVTSAKLEVTSTNSGFLPPRMSAVQRNTIPSPVAGLIIWCSDCGIRGELQVFDGVNWTNIHGGTTLDPLSIGAQSWMLYNLNVDKYRNGDPIPKVTDATAWTNLVTGAYCYYNNDSATYAAIYGKLYNWYAVNDSRGLAPAGWHIPTEIEWTSLTTYLGGETIAGGPLKETGTAHWATPNTGATNSSGFTGLPAGYRANFGSFSNVTTGAWWWTATQDNAANAWYRSTSYGQVSIGRSSTAKQLGASVRCIKD